MFHTDSSLNWRAIGNKTFTSKWNLFSTEHLFSKDVVGNLLHKTDRAKLFPNKGENDVKCKR